MKAVVYNHETIVADAVLPKPALVAGQVLIEVRAASLNPIDYKLPLMPGSSRVIEGRPTCLDLAGVVVAVAPDVTSLKPGDEVYGNHASGTLAEYVAAKAACVARKPSNINFVEAAALPTVALTSLQALRKGNVRPDKHVLVIGASGGCGSMGVQLAKAMKAVATGVCSAKNAAMVKEYGADVVIDYTSQKVPRTTAFDCIYDTVTSPEDQNYQSLKETHLKQGGSYVCINGFGADWFRHLVLRPLSCGFVDSPLVLTNHSTEDLDCITSWVEAGALRPQVQNVFGFSAEAWREAVGVLKSRRATGKLVFHVS